VGPIRVPAHLTDEQVLFLSDILPTGHMAAENCNIRPGDTVAVWGCGPVGQFAIKSAYLLGADRVIAIDRWPERLLLAETSGKAETINYEEIEDVVEELKQRTGGRGPEACIDAVGTEAHGTSIDALYDRAKVAVGLGTDAASRASPGHPGVPEGRHCFHPRRVRRAPRQGALRRGLREGADAPHGANARAPLPPAAPGPHREWADRPHLRHQPPLALESGPGGLSHVQRQA
jgi:NADPH:quinone reductase-like Zn-dependent oxidoreductase